MELGQNVGGTAVSVAEQEKADTGRTIEVAGWTWPRATLAERVVQAAVAAVLAGGIAVGLYLRPSPTGTGTHTILGLPPCGMLVATGRPCPTCGVTTSFALAAHGRIVDSLKNQPFGLLLFGLAAVGLMAVLTTLVAGRSWGPVVTPWTVKTFVLALMLAGLASWAYKWCTM